jgi:hypothetical protein
MKMDSSHHCNQTHILSLPSHCSTRGSKPRRDVLSELLAILTPNEPKHYFPVKAWGGGHGICGELQCPVWHFTGHLCMSNCVFCVRRAACTRQKLIRTPAKGLFVISGLSEESAGPMFLLQVDLLLGSVHISTRLLPTPLLPTPLFVCFPKLLFVLLLQTEVKENP